MKTVYKAKYIESYRGEKNDINLVYQYRGYEYVVVKYGWGGCTDTLRGQHQREQHRIDDIIADRERLSKDQRTPEDIKKEWDEIWDMI